jgi:cupin fold WbuC family metalloprotein
LPKNKQKNCRVCNTGLIVKLLDVGEQPVSNRFVKDTSLTEYTHSMSIGQCNACALLQIINPVPANELVTPYDWITYNEPEGHLDEVSNIITNLPSINKDSSFMGISFKEDTTLQRLINKGFKNIHRLDQEKDLEITRYNTGLESIQEKVNVETFRKLALKYGTADVIIVRHILEHAADPRHFMEALQQMLKPKGYVIFEVPDFSNLLDCFDYSSLWEEHILYFTPETFKNSLACGGFSIFHFEVYPYPTENSLIAIVQPESGLRETVPAKEVLLKEQQKATVYSNHFPKKNTATTSYLTEFKKNHGKISMFGAGHIACMYINIMGLKDMIEFVVDDDPNKKGLFMPGSLLPIYGSEKLIQENIKLCLTSLSPESEEKVIKKNQEFIKQGGVFSSIISEFSATPVTRTEFKSEKDGQQMQTKKISDAIYYPDEWFVHVQKKDIDFLKTEVDHTEFKRNRLCTHLSIEDALHEMFIVLSKNNYIRPAKHVGKDESLHVIEGCADAVFFDESGKITKVVSLGDYASGKRFYYRISEPIYHTLLIKTDFFVFHEATTGPLRKADTVLAPWAPDENDIDASREFVEQLANSVKNFVGSLTR